MIKMAINGFGRIGRAAFKIALEKEGVEVVAINDLTDAPMLAHLLQYDTAYGKYQYEVVSKESSILVNGKEYTILSEPDPEKLPWDELDVDVVLECTGRFVKDGASQAHITAGAKKVVLSAPAKGTGDVPTILLGVNSDSKIDADIVSNASCTTNCIGPVVDIMNSKFGIQKAMMTTVHSYTAQQRLQDAPHKDMRRARAAAQNIVPTTTGAALATTKVIPELKGSFDGMAIRVPTIVVSLSDLTFVLKKEVTVDDVNSAFIEASQQPELQGILGVTTDPLVSSDLIGDSRSSKVDLSLTKVVGGDLVKVIAWYDNEWGYSNRLVEMVESVA